MMMPTEQQVQFREKIANLKDFNETFELVKAVVSKNSSSIEPG